MPTRMAIWRLSEEGSAVPVDEEQLPAESMIESAVESAPELLGVDVLIIGRQVPTPSGPLDLLAMDGDRRLVVIENKRDRTPREVLAQTIDYAAYVASLTFDQVASIYESYQARRGDSAADLLAAFEEHFGEPLDSVGDTPRMIVMASRLDDSTQRMLGFLVDRFDVPVNAALFQHFSGGLIGRTWLRSEESVRPLRRAQSSNQAREQSKIFWDAWLPIGREALPEIRLPAEGPRSVFITRRIVPGRPASLALWVSASEAYAEVQFDDEAPTVNAAILLALRSRTQEIEAAFGGPLDWYSQEDEGPMIRRTKIIARKVAIGDRTKPTNDGLVALADVAQRLLNAVRPYLQEAFDRASEETFDDIDDDNSGDLPAADTIPSAERIHQ